MLAPHFNNYSELPLIWTPKMWPPLLFRPLRKVPKLGFIIQIQYKFPLKWGHPYTLIGPKGGQIRGSPPYSETYVCTYHLSIKMEGKAEEPSINIWRVGSSKFGYYTEEPRLHSAAPMYNIPFGDTTTWLLWRVHTTGRWWHFVRPFQPLESTICWSSQRSKARA